MRRLFQALVFLSALWLGTACVAAAAEPSPVGGEAADPPQQMLVMFHLPPAHFSPNPGYAGSYGERLGHSARRRLAVAVARRYGLTLVGHWEMPLAGVDCFVMSVPKDQSTAELAARVSRDKRVAWAEPIEVYSAQAGAHAYNDPLFAMQSAGVDWRLADLHQLATGRGVRVAVVDSLVDRSHPDLAGQVVASEDFAPRPATGPEQHGTAVAGLIAARAHNAKGIVGVAPGARLLALRACVELRPPQRDATTTCDSLSLAKALVFAINHRTDVVNLSLSGAPAPLLARLLDAALARGITVVGAFDNRLPKGGFPASHPGVIAVATAPSATAKWVYVAPGRDLLTTEPGGGWGLANGSSYAAAQVSGLFALLREKGGGRQETLAMVSQQTRAIDPCATLLRVSGPCACACARLAAASAAQD